MSADNFQKSLTPQETLMTAVTIGTVVDTADPQQMGRVRAVCPAFGDKAERATEKLPWCEYASPFAGDVQMGTRGPNGDEVSGPTSYGLWAIPKVGAQVLVMCVDGNPMHRVWIACLYSQFGAHTMPHGRYSYDSQNVVEDENNVAGPYDSFEGAIEPLYTNMIQAFGTPSTGNINFEFASRGADFQAAAITSTSQLNVSLSETIDDINIDSGMPGNLETVTQGYRENLIVSDDIIVEDSNTQDDNRSQTTITSNDNMVTALVSAGFHAVSMDDRPENSRIRFRTAGGHQIILDDTNERIYISTATGKNWIELDQQGNIDIFTEGKMSVTAEHDINFNTNGSFRVRAAKGIHLNSEKEIRMAASQDISVKSDSSLRLLTGSPLYLQSEKSIHFKSGADLNLTGGGSLNVKSNTNVVIQAGTNFSALASGSASLDGATVGFNEGRSGAASAADPADATTAFVPNRVPAHEPWGRTGTESDNSLNPLFDYSSAQNGIEDYATGDDGTSSLQITKTRNPRWRR